jgi:hypothetical protein
VLGGYGELRELKASGAYEERLGVCGMLFELIKNNISLCATLILQNALSIH